MSARLVREIRVPVSAPIRIMETAVPLSASVEYTVVEEWSDGTIRHPLTRNIVTGEFWRVDRKEALHFLRTGEREVRYIMYGEW